MQFRVVTFKQNTLFNRYSPALNVKTAGVFFMDDDDAPPDLLTLELGLAVWKCNPASATYYETRDVQRDPSKITPVEYISTGGRIKGVALGIPRYMFISSDWFCYIASPALQGLRHFVSEHACVPDDISLGFVIQFFGNSTPQVIPRVQTPNSRRLMAGSPRWSEWRSEALYWVARYFAKANDQFRLLRNGSCSYNHFGLDECKSPLTLREAKQLVRDSNANC